MSKSYAQFGEDVRIDRLLGHQGVGTYIDVGAWDPEVDSVTKLFYDRGWRGVNVEPNRVFARKLREARPRDVNLEMAISDAGGMIPMRCSPDTGLSTLEREYIRWDHPGEWYDVAVRRLESVFEIVPTHPSGARGRVDFLKIDVEGHELQVLAGNDWARYRPTLVVIEARAPNSTVPTWDAWEPIVLSAGYCLVDDDGLNRYYLTTETKP